MNKIDWERIQRGVARRISKVVPLRWTTTVQLAARNGGDWTEVFPAARVPWPEQLPSGPPPRTMVEKFFPETGPKGILRLRHAFVFSSHGWVFTRGGWRVLDLSHYSTLVDVAPRVRLPFPRFKARQLRGTTLSLLSTWGSYNYFHFLLESLPRLELFRQAGLDWNKVDHILFPDFRSPSADRMVERLKLPEKKVIRIARNDPLFVQADELLCPSFPAARRVVAPWAVAFLRRVRELPPTRGGRRLFIPRRARNRFLRNEAELWRLLSVAGFEAFDPAGEPDAEAAFHAADAIVGVHGAALANLAFCRPGTRVLELLPSDHCVPFYLSLSTGGDLAYDCIVGQSERDVARPPHEEYNSPYDFEVSPIVFAERLPWLLQIGPAPGSAPRQV